MTITKVTIYNILFCLILNFFCTKAAAQSYLDKLIYIGDLKPLRIGVLLNQISSKQNFSFAYNNNTIPADSIVAVSGYQGTIFSLLEKILGKNFEYKEVPGHVVLRYAPGRLVISAEIENEQGKITLIKGYVHNLANQKAIPRASVYEERILVSTLTDEKGYFELRIKNWSGQLVVAVRKETFRDTSIHLLADVMVKSKPEWPNYSYYPDEGPRSVENSRFARFFLSSKQLIQGLNLDNFFTSRPYQISLTPGLSSRGLYNSQIIDLFSLNLLGGYTAGIDGLEIAGIFNINRKNVQYFQAAGGFNFVGGNQRGIQLAGIYNNVVNNAVGFQAAGFVNRAGSFLGRIQMAGGANVNKSADGVSIAGLGNFSQNSSDVQVAGLINNGGKRTNFQLAGLLNIADTVKRTQIGLVNIADSSDYPIGILNFIKTGEKCFAIATDETLFTQLDFRSGGRVLYSLLGAGYRSGKDGYTYQLNFGAGAHLNNLSKFNLNTELTGSFITDFKEKNYQRNSLKVLPAFKLEEYIRVFAGPTLNSTTADKDIEIPENGWIIKEYNFSKYAGYVSLGVSAGLQYNW